jgi:hypothetical protein
MTYWNERRVRLLLRLAMLVGAMLSAVSLASALHWVTIGREQTFALGFALVDYEFVHWAALPMAPKPPLRTLRREVRNLPFAVIRTTLL